MPHRHKRSSSRSRSVSASVPKATFPDLQNARKCRELAAFGLLAEEGAEVLDWKFICEIVSAIWDIPHRPSDEEREQFQFDSKTYTFTSHLLTFDSVAKVLLPFSSCHVTFFKASEGLEGSTVINIQSSFEFCFVFVLFLVSEQTSITGQPVLVQTINQSSASRVL